MASEMQTIEAAVERPDEPRRGRPAGARPERLLLLVAISACAGVIHAKAMFDHATHYWLFGVFFGALTYAQVGWAAWIYRRSEDRRTWMPVAVGSLAVVAIWIVSRTVGLPFGPWAGRPEPLGLADVAASIDELVLTGLVVAMLRPGRWIAARFAWLDGANCTRVGTMLCVLSFCAVAIGHHLHPAVR
jgi:hypothetical protein